MLFLKSSGWMLRLLSHYQTVDSSAVALLLPPNQEVSNPSFYCALLLHSLSQNRLMTQYVPNLHQMRRTVDTGGMPW